MLVLSKSGEIFLGERHGSKGVWQFPQGGVNDGVPLEENVLRELEEELGANKALFKIVAKLPVTHEYEFQDPPGYALGKWRGQSQTFWAVRFLGKDSDIDLANHKEPEFMSWKWLKASEVLLHAEPRRHEGYKKALDALQTLKIVQNS